MDSTEPRGFLSERYALDRFRARWNAIAKRPEADVEEMWRRSNPQGQRNFCMWMAKQYVDKACHQRWRKFILVRIDDKLPYGPDNCEVVNGSEFYRRHPRQVVTNVLKNAVAEYVKDHPEATATQVAGMFPDYGYTTIYTIYRNIKKAKTNDKKLD